MALFIRQIDRWQVNRPLDVRASADSDNIHPCLAHDPGRTERIFCGIPEQGLWCSDDAGSAWSLDEPLSPAGSAARRSAKSSIGFLRGEQSGSLRALARRNEHFSRIARVLKHPPCRVRRAAPYGGPGEAGGHERVGLPSPLQAGDGQLSGPVPQADSTRPSQAAHGHDGYNASTAPRAVGYESRSQFSREFKRLFGVTPVEGTENARARFAVG
jgi:AraC-like DNA-binding protein